MRISRMLLYGKSLIKRRPTLIMAGALFLFFSIFAFSSVAQAVDLGLNTAANIGLPVAPQNDIRELLVDIIRYILGFLGIIAVAVIMYAGFLWMTSAGDPARLERGKRTLINGVVGLIIILTSFAIVTFIVNLFHDSIYGPGTKTGHTNYGGGIGALGACAVESVYPEYGQTDVARNTPIMVTFKDPVNPVDICGNSACSGNPIVPANIRIFKSNQGDSCEWDGGAGAWINCDASNIVNALVSQSGNTFVISPAEFLGSPSENIEYTVYFSSDIRGEDGRSILATCRNTEFLSWNFTVSNRVDLEPPQVLAKGVFPPPDDSPDSEVTAAADYATGLATVEKQPQFGRSARLGAAGVQRSPTAATWNNATAAVNPACSQNGDISVYVSDADSGTVTFSKDSGATLLGNATMSGSQVTFSGCFTLTVIGGSGTLAPGEYETGNAWTVPVVGMAVSDNLRIGSVTYRFVEITAIPGDNEIALGGTAAVTASNISSKINTSHPQVTSTVGGTTITITAKVPGAAGNSIGLSTNNSDAFSFTPANHLSGGVDAGVTPVREDAWDQPMNAIVQINFNEAINPIAVSGPTSLVDAIRVTRVGFGEVAGKFVVSNQYRTVEFIPDNECGQNSCGDPIYCLPPDSQIQVWLHAATLEACVNCSAKTPYTSCTAGHCYDAAALRNYPLSSAALDGVMDATRNSLDGNRDSDADGPVSDFSENNDPPDPATGDNFVWTFYTNHDINNTPPSISVTVPANHPASERPLDQEITIQFDKPMLSSSLKTGRTTITRDGDRVTHQNINLWNMANRPTGYWISKEDIYDGSGFVISTNATINHAQLAETVTYRVQAGSGVRDIYQNCFRPSDGPACSLSPSDISCCSGTASTAETCP